MINISIVKLENNLSNKKVLVNFINKDTENKCFLISGYDELDKENTPEKMAELFFEEIDFFGIKYLDKYIGILCAHDGLVGIFVEPEYQRKGFGKKALIMFEDMVKERYKYNELIAEIVSDNAASINFFSQTGYQYTNEHYDSPMNGNNITFLKYKKVLSNNQKNITQII